MTTMDLNKYRKQVNDTWRKNRWWIDGRLIKLRSVKDHHIENRHGKPIRVRQYSPKHTSGKTLFYLHGGGWVGRNIDTYDNFCRRVCRNTGMTVYSIGYRLSPEAKFPGAIEDGIDVIRKIISIHELDTGTIYLCGDSAGGNMAIGITYLLQSEIKFQKLLLLYPPVTAELNQPSMDEYGAGYIIEKYNIGWMRDQYLESKDQYMDPMVSPLYHNDLNFLPETMISVGGKDPLHDQVMEFANKMKSQDGPIMVQKYPDLPHGFYLLRNLSRTVRKAYEDVDRFLR